MLVSFYFCNSHSNSDTELGLLFFMLPNLFKFSIREDFTLVHYDFDIVNGFYYGLVTLMRQVILYNYS